MSFVNVPNDTSAALIPPGSSVSVTKTVAPGGSRFLIVTLNTAVASGGNTVQVTINGVTATGYAYPILVGVAVAVAAVTPYRVGPGLTPSANAVANDVVPAVIQVVVTVVGTVSYGVDVELAA